MDWTLEFTCYTNWRGDWKRHKWNFNTYMWRFGRWKLVNGKKSTKKCTRESWNYLQTSELVSLWKENLPILESSQCNKGCQAWPRKTKLQYKNKMYNLKDLYKNAKLNDNKRGAAPQTSPFFDVFDEVSSSRDVVDIPEKKKVGYVRQTSSRKR